MYNMMRRAIGIVGVICTKMYQNIMYTKMSASFLSLSKEAESEADILVL